MNKDEVEKLFRLASLVGTDAKNPKEKLLSFVNQFIEKAYREGLLRAAEKIANGFPYLAQAIRTEAEASDE